MNLQVGLIWVGVVAAATTTSATTTAAAATTTTKLQCQNNEFQCTNASQCINATGFCDGEKDCQNGSDEPLRNVNDDYDANSKFCRGEHGDICVVPKSLLTQGTRVCQKGPCPPYALLDVVVVLDSSPSVGVHNWDIMKNVVAEVIRSFQIGPDLANFAIFRYNRRVDASSQIYLNSYSDVDDIIRALYRLPYNGPGTRTGQALVHALEVSLSEASGNRPGVPDIVVLFTDGISQDDVKPPADNLHANGARIIVIGVSGSNLDELLEIAGSWDNLIYVSGFSRLNNVFTENLVSLICGAPYWKCESDEFACADESQCIDANWFCDGNIDCRDGSDEILRNIYRKNDANSIFCRGNRGDICVAPKNSTKICNQDWQCKSNEFACADGTRCIGMAWFCDGAAECRDGSDEYMLRNISISIDANSSFCRGSSGNICIVPKSLIPQVESFCKKDWKCKSNEFECADGSKCINTDRFCDTRANCRDRSDEPPLRDASISYDTNSTFCRSSSGNICVVPKSLIPQVESFCKEELQCGSKEFECADKSRCIDATWFCDGGEDCRDGSDEPLRNVSTTYAANLTFCRAQRGHICVVQETLLPSLKGICQEDWQCERDKFECTDGSRCINATWLCDWKDDCRDGSDEYQMRNRDITYDANSTYCRVPSGNICVVPKSTPPRLKEFCKGDWECESNEFQCADGSMCAGAGSWFCDGVENCQEDKSEEILRSRRNYEASDTYYQGGHDRVCVIPDRLSTFKEEMCAMKNDSCSCKHQETNIIENGCFRCLSNPHFVLQVSQICDGIVDCPDLSDECLCLTKSRLGICQSVIERKTERENTVHMVCKSLNQSTLVVDQTMICDGSVDCSDGVDEKGCPRKKSSKIEEPYDCPITELEQCDDRKLKANCRDCFCMPSAEQYCDYLRNLEKMNGLDGFLRCFDDSEDHGKRMCDGIRDCDDEIDEKYCTATRYYCKSEPLPNIPRRERCDFKEQCENGTDELNCTSHHYCLDDGEIKYISRSLKSDGVDDCKSGSDESDINERFPCSVDSLFSDKESMISNKMVLAFVWIISVSAMVGCSAVIGSTIRDFIGRKKREKRRSSDHTQVFQILILSLSMSDFLVAVYTLMICVKAVQFDHDYCRQDRDWRSSRTCSALGVLSVLGSEQSVFTMVLIAVLRTYFVWRPFARPNVRAVICAILVTWIMSIVLSTVPLTPSLEDYFVKDMQFQNNGLLRVVSTYDLQYTIDWLSFMPEAQDMSPSETDWTKLRNLAWTVNPSTTFTEFGYYSTHTVCLPTLFPDTSEEPAWHFTLFLILINVLAFFAMLVLYAILYRLASKKRALRESIDARKKQRQINVKMQRKLTRIVASDFFCWMPICTMGLMRISGYNIPRDAYVPAGLLIIPINSALNPLLYSDIPEFVIQKLKEMKDKVCRPNEPGVKMQKQVVSNEVMLPQTLSTQGTVSQGP